MDFTTRPNQQTRNRIKRMNMPSWRLAQIIGVHRATLSDWLNLPESNPRIKLINDKLDEIEKEGAEKC